VNLPFHASYSLKNDFGSFNECENDNQFVVVISNTYATRNTKAKTRTTWHDSSRSKCHLRAGTIGNDGKIGTSLAETSNGAIQEAKNSDGHENIGLIEAARDYLEKIKK